jgi:hypothetical protein
MELQKRTLHIKYFEYWDHWHEGWYRQTQRWLNESHFPDSEDIIVWRDMVRITTFRGDPLNALDDHRNYHAKTNGWKIPFKGVAPSKGKDEIDCWKFFPVPYLGDSTNTSYKAIFLSQNYQKPTYDFNIVLGAYDWLLDAYRQHKYGYSETVRAVTKDVARQFGSKQLSENIDTATELLQFLGESDKLTERDVMQCFLVPWATHSENEISTLYLQDNHQTIYDKVLKPIASISSSMNSPLRNIVLMRCNKINKLRFTQFQIHHFTDKNSEENQILAELNNKKNGWGISYFFIKDTAFINFSFHGGDRNPSSTSAMSKVIKYIVKQQDNNQTTCI